MKKWLKENINFVILNLIVWVLSTSLILGIIISFNNITPKKHSVKIQSMDSLEVIAFKDSVLNYIYDMRLEHPYIVYAQCIVETGNFTSTIMKENNNLFGMKLPERRATLALGVKRGHAYYRNWKESIIDYSLYQMAYMRGLSEEEYFEKLKQSYASDTYYINKIRQLKQSLSR